MRLIQSSLSNPYIPNQELAEGVLVFTANTISDTGKAIITKINTNDETIKIDLKKIIVDSLDYVMKYDTSYNFIEIISKHACYHFCCSLI